MLNADWHRAHVMPKNATLSQRVAWHREHLRHCGCRPPPQNLLALLAASDKAEAPAHEVSRGEPPPLRELLRGGDRRSVAQSERAHEAIRARPERTGELAALVSDPDWLVGMRALDLLEKLAHEQRAWVEPHRSVFLGPAADSDKWECRLQVVRALPLFAWEGRELARAIAILRRDAEHPQTFVRAWATDGLATFAERDPKLIPEVRRRLDELDRSGKKALATRARKIRERIPALRQRA